MNKIYRVIWSKTKNCYVVVSEYAKRNGKYSSSLNKKLIAAFLAAGTALSVTGSVWAADMIIVKGDTNATATGTVSIAIGNGATVDAQDSKVSSIAFGNEANVQSTYAIAIGDSATIMEGGVAAIAIGASATANNNSAIAIGNNAQAQSASGKESSVAIGAGAKATADSTLAIGHGAQADISSSYAVGFGAHASASHAMALGTRASVTGSNGIAIGVQTESTEQAAVAIGSGSKAKGTDSVAIGQSAKALGSNSIKIGGSSLKGAAEGFGSVAIGNSSTAIGQWYSTATGYRSLALSDSATTYGSVSSASKESVAIGAYSYAGTRAGEVLAEVIPDVTRATAIGYYSMATGKLSTATGAYSRATGDYSTAGGYYSQAVGSNSTAVGYYSLAGTAATDETAEKTAATAVGYYSKATGQYSTALGAFTNYSGNDSEGTTAIGYNSAVTVANGVALGRGAVANTEAGTTTKTSGYDPITNGPSSIEDAIWRSTLGAVSVGNGGTSTRQITNVAAGSADTDAVNVAQLKAAQVEIIGGDNVYVDTDTSSGHTKFTIHALNAIVEAGENITVTATTPNTNETNGQTADPTAGGNGIETNDHTTTYTVSSTGGGGGIAEISFNGDNKDAQIDSPKVLNIEGGATGELSDGNIGVESDGKDTLTVKLAKDIKDVDTIEVNKTITVGGSTTINSDGMTIKDGPSVTKDGIDAGGKKITNVASGTADNDAATVGQLKNASGDIYNEINRLDNSTRKGIAGAAALAALHPMDFNPDDKLQFSAGVGNYRGETAGALGMFYRPDESVMFSLGGTFGNSDNMVNAGITFGLDGTRNRISRSRTAMAKEIVELRSLVTQMAARMDRLEGGTNLETAMFPDVPENHWAYEYVEDLQKRGAIKGYPDGLFKGDRSMTRYEFAAMLDRLVRSGVTLDSKIAKEFEPELGRIYVERISGQDNDRKKVERVRVNNSDSKRPEGKTRDAYGSKIVTEIPKAAETK